MNLIRDKIHSIVCSLSNGQAFDSYSTVDCEKALVLNLLQEEFLLPSREFLDNLVDPHTDGNTSDSLNVWAEENLFERNFVKYAKKDRECVSESSV